MHETRKRVKKEGGARVTSKRERFNAEIERMKPYYRRFNSERLVAMVRRGGSVRPYVAAAKAVLKERGIDFKGQ